MRCINLVELIDGVVCIGGCRLSEDINITKTKLSQFSTKITESVNSITCDMNVTTMKYGLCFEDKHYSYSSIKCDYYVKEDNYFHETKNLYRIEYRLNFSYGYPFLTIADFEEIADNWVKSKLFKNCEFEVHPQLNINEIYLEGKKCDIEIQWTKRNDNNTMYIIFRVLPPCCPDENIFDTSAAITKSEKKLALRLGKDVSELSNFERDEACLMCGIPPHDLDIP